MCKLTLPLEVGKKYVRKDGAVARCVATDRCDPRYGHTAVLLYQEGDTEWSFATRPDGTSEGAGATLVSDYVEPIKDRYVVIDQTGALLHAGSTATPEGLAFLYRIPLANGGRIIKIREVRD